MRENSWPFLGSEARTAGDAIKRSLRSQHEMIYRNVYLPKGQEVTPVTRAVAAWLWSGGAATVAGLSAAAFHGSGWIDAGLSAELIRAEACGVDGIGIHREKLESDEV